VTPHQTPLLLVISLGGDLPSGSDPRRLAELVMAELGVQTVVVDAGARPATSVRLVREIVREHLRPAALLVPLDAFGWPA
jgi:hypothetical protein